jgi:N-methylhydantoinase B
MEQEAVNLGSIPPADAVELEVFKHLFAAVADEMGVRLMRSAFSPNIKERRDFSCAVFDSAGQMLAQAAHIPVHLGSMPMAVDAVLARFPAARMQPGERFVVNDPFAGGTHLPDITVVAPCILSGETQPRFFVANRAHHADIGGISPGSMPLSSSIEEEGLRIPPLKLDAQTLAWICAQSRTPDERGGDLRAQLAALDAGALRLGAMARRYGAAVVEQRGRELLDYTERLMRAVLNELPDGSYTFTDVLDGDGFETQEIPICCELTMTGGSACFDFSASGDQVRGPVNAVRAITTSAVNYVLRCLMPADVPSNAGLMRPVEIRTRPGSITDAKPPSAVAAGNVETSQRIVDVVLGALAQALPSRIPAASCGSMNNITAGSLSADEPFAYYETIGGGAGGGPLRGGASALHTHMTNTLNTPVEALEHAYPMRIEEYAIATGTGGAGLHPGGDGIVRRYSFGVPVEVTLLTGRRTQAPYGLHGGGAGAVGRNAVINADGTRRALPGKCNVRLEPGQQLELTTPGGGGWGTGR